MGKLIGVFGVAAILSVLAYIGLTAGYRFGALDLGQVFSMIKYLTFVLLGAGGLALLLGLGGLFTGRGGAGLMAIIGGIAALGAATGPLMMRMQAAEVPAIHDITTDVQYPPQFIAIRDIRIAEESPNDADYDVEQTTQQMEAYPDLDTVTFDKPYEEVFAASVEVLESMGLSIVATEENAGRIEATATTFWWGFKDDVVVRVNRFSETVEVDVRSKSRVGKSDLGVNAKRIETFLTKLDEKLA